MIRADVRAHVVESADAASTAWDFPGITYNNFKQILRDYFELHFGHAPDIQIFDRHLCRGASICNYSADGNDYEIFVERRSSASAQPALRLRP